MNEEKLPALIPTQPSSLVEKIDQIAPKSWRMKLARAAAQLIAGTEKGAVAYGEIRERIDTVEGRSVVSKALAEAVAQQAVNDPELVERAKARFLSSAMQKQQNLEAVIKGASEKVLLLPPPDSPIEPQTMTIASGQNAAQDEMPLNPDWAATFSDLAENATSEDLQDRLSRVLAGEISSPGTYPRATIRQVAELEQHDLKAMQAVLPFVLAGEIIKKKDDELTPNFAMMQPLVEAGLATDTNLLAKSWKVAEHDEQPYGIAGKVWGLVVYMRKGQNITLPMAPLTRTGCAVADLLGRPDEREILKRIASEIPLECYSRILLGRQTGPNTTTDLIQILPQLASTTISPNMGASPFSSLTLKISVP